jgi:hypothetical protein
MALAQGQFSLTRYSAVELSAHHLPKDFSMSVRWLPAQWRVKKEPALRARHSAGAGLADGSLVPDRAVGYMTMVRIMMKRADDPPHQSVRIQGQMPRPNG